MKHSDLLGPLDDMSDELLLHFREFVDAYQSGSYDSLRNFLSQKGRISSKDKNFDTVKYNHEIFDLGELVDDGIELTIIDGILSSIITSVENSLGSIANQKYIQKIIRTFLAKYLGQETAYKYLLLFYIAASLSEYSVNLYINDDNCSLSFVEEYSLNKEKDASGFVYIEIDFSNIVYKLFNHKRIDSKKTLYDLDERYKILLKEINNQSYQKEEMVIKFNNKGVPYETISDGRHYNNDKLKELKTDLGSSGAIIGFKEYEGKNQFIAIRDHKTYLTPKPGKQE